MKTIETASSRPWWRESVMHRAAVPDLSAIAAPCMEVP
jgi:hypothetical protein